MPIVQERYHLSCTVWIAVSRHKCLIGLFEEFFNLCMITNFRVQFLQFYKFVLITLLSFTVICLQCFDTVDCLSGRASVL